MNVLNAVSREELDSFVKNVMDHLQIIRDGNSLGVNNEFRPTGRIVIQPNDSKKVIRNKLWNYINGYMVDDHIFETKFHLAHYPEKMILKVDKLREFSLFQNAVNIKCDPDIAFCDTRQLILMQGKKLFVPLSKKKKGLLYQLEIAEGAGRTRGYLKYLSSLSGMNTLSKYVPDEKIPKLDMVIVGSIGVDEQGNQIGKGGGFSDLEYCILREYNIIDERTCIVGMVNENQIYEGYISHHLITPHDILLDYIITPQRIIKTKPIRPKPSKIIWNEISRQQIGRMFLLSKLRLKHFDEGKDVRAKFQQTFPDRKDLLALQQKE
ncbi:hypothetical protein SNEBB_007779 [Seison nebaliae]|nr:hypothetical protein SNEBB_007779 [Seison nebaliae]